MWITSLYPLFMTMFALCQYQQCTHLIGSGKNTEAIYGTGIFEMENIGGVFGSTSFLVNSNSQILVFFGVNNGERSDRIWKYSIKENQWKFIKGRKESNQGPIFLELNTFKEENEIGSRVSSAGWKNQNIITLFGGEGHYKGTSKINYLNEMWRYNISSNLFSVIRCNDDEQPSDSFLTNFTNTNVFNTSTVPGGRKMHTIITINSQLIMLIGGYGFFKTKELCDLPDWYFFSTELMQWNYLGGEGEIFLSEETNVYHPNNTFGSIRGASGTLINDEEVLIFGGKQNDDFFNTIFKYNITSNYWKYVSGGKDVHGTGYLRYFNSSNFPGARYGHKIWKINNHELLLFGGEGNCFFSEQEYGYLNDEWRFDLNSDLWKFVGKEKTKLKDREPNFEANSEYSDDTLVGGIKEFIGEYIEENKELIICNGEGYSVNGNNEVLDDCWNVYYGNICNLIKDTDSEVCLGRGKCVDYNYCECDNEFFGDNCELTKCNGIFSNETDTVCSQKGVCINSKCLCYEQSIYNNLDCTINEELQNFVNNIWIFIVVPMIIILLLVIIFFISLFSFLFFKKQKKKLKKLDEIEDLDIILEEQKIAKDSSIAHFKINQNMFEINSKDIQIIEKIGQGGSSAVVYSAKWNNQKVAYKCFIVQDFLENKFSEFEKEVELLASISFPFILTFYGATLNSQRLGFVMEYAENGDLKHFLNQYLKKNGRKYEFDEKVRMLFEISSAMLFIHNKNVIHRDLKPQNVLVTSNEETKLMDFGLAKIVDNDLTKTKKVGTTFFIAPEVLQGNYSFPCDVFSFSMLMYVVMTEKFSPFGKNKINIAHRISTDPQFRPDLKDLENTYGKGESENIQIKGIKELIKRNWDHDESKRMKFKEITQSLQLLLKQKKEKSEEDQTNWRIEFKKLELENRKLKERIQELNKRNIQQN